MRSGASCASSSPTATCASSPTTPRATSSARATSSTTCASPTRAWAASRRAPRPVRRVGFVYDTEERLIAIENEHGHVYKFQLDAAGRVEVESGFDGIRRQYQRDKAGRVTKVYRPASLETKYAYDPAGRVVGVEHSDGSAEAYAYRKDGELVEAKNDAATVKLERDLLGRVVRETVGDDWIASEYNALGMRVRLRSSKGLDQRIERNAVGQMTGVRAARRARERRRGRCGRAFTDGDVWEARVTRDVLGLEIERQLPGGVRARWQRDAIGRPTQQEITVAGEFRRAVHYTWEVNDRLRMVVDAARGPVRYEHDALGNLAAATYEDGRVDLRMPDAVGNLFRTQARTDRKYGPAGQLLESREPDGRVVTYEYDPEGNLVRKTERDPEPARFRCRVSAATPPLRPRLDLPLERRRHAHQGRSPRRRDRDLHLRRPRAPPLQDLPRPHHQMDLGRRRPPARVGRRPRRRRFIRPPGALADVAVLDELAARRRRFERAAKPSQGPPSDPSRPPNPPPPPSPSGAPAPPSPAPPKIRSPGSSIPRASPPWPSSSATPATRSSPTTSARPTAMYDAAGAEVWSATIDAYGDLRNVTGTRTACPFRWPGQYEDAETGLYYNRFRYYDPNAGGYIAHDPLGLRGGLRLQGYVSDPAFEEDPLGLSCSREKPRIEDGNLREGWVHIDARHVAGNHPRGPGDLFAPGTTRAELQEAAEYLVEKGTRISDPAERLQSLEKRMKVNGRRDRVRVVVDSQDGNRVISIFPVRSE